MRKNKKIVSFLIVFIIGIMISTTCFASVTADEINKMSDAEIKNVSTQDLQNFVDSYSGAASAHQTIATAVSKARAELNSRNKGQTGYKPQTGNDYLDYLNYQPSEASGYDKATTMAGYVLGLLRNIGIIIAVVVLSIIGIKYMFGSVQEKADYKKSLVPYVIGAALIAFIPTVIKVFYEFVIDSF